VSIFILLWEASLFSSVISGEHVEMQYFLITEGSANLLKDITEQAQTKFENPNIILVQSNGLKIGDNKVTRSKDTFLKKEFFKI